MDISNIDGQSLIDNMPCGIVVHAPDTSVLYANPQALEILKLTRDQVRGKDALDPQWRFIDEEGRTIEPPDYPVNRLLSRGKPLTNHIMGIVDSDEQDVTWVMINAYLQKDQTGMTLYAVIMFYDITKEKKSIPFKDIVALASDAVIVTEATPLDDPGPRIVYVNDAFTDISGYTPDEVIGKTPRILQGDKTEEDAKKRMRDAFQNEQPVREIVLNYDKSGQEYWLDLNIYPLFDPFGNITHFAAIERDITQMKQQEEDLRLQASQDPLTGLLNRRGFGLQSRFVLAQGRRMKWPLAVIMMDIDHFKSVNDTWGHDVGDDLLRELAGLLTEETRESDVLGRLGGEEFALILPNTTVDNALSVAENLRRAVEDFRLPLPETPENTPFLDFTISLGLTAAKTPPADIDDLLKQADTALYEAKRSGRNQVCLYK